MSKKREILRVSDLAVTYRASGHGVPAVKNVSMSVRSGEILAVVGESGSGKTTTAQAVLRLLPEGARIVGGGIHFDGEDLASLSEEEMQRIRGRRIGLIPQDPTSSLSPLLTVGQQVAEVMKIHHIGDAKERAARAEALLEEAGLDRPAMRLRQYPHELSGGMCQRVLIAMAIACEPKLLIADEPTSALDVTVQRRILDRLELLVEEHDTGILLITHDLAVAASRASNVVVMQHGTVVESGAASEILKDPQHPYTRELIAASPSLTSRRLVSSGWDGGTDAETTPFLSVRGLEKTFHASGSGGPSTTRAVDGVSFDVPRGTTTAIVGESGSGKSTTARLILQLEKSDHGEVKIDGEDISDWSGGRLRELRSRVQVVFQSPWASLNPRMTLKSIVTEPMRTYRLIERSKQAERAAALLDQVGLSRALLSRTPAELSGGQRQRVAIARALAFDPELIVCDEPVSALDASAQAQVLELLAKLQNERNLSYVFISHDLAVVRQIAHRIVVMRRGKVVEEGMAEDIFASPKDHYTRELLEAIPGHPRRSRDRGLSTHL